MTTIAFHNFNYIPLLHGGSSKSRGGWEDNIPLAEADKGRAETVADSVMS